MSRDELRKIGEGLEAEMFAWGKTMVLRLMRDPQAVELNNRQALAMGVARPAACASPPSTT